MKLTPQEDAALRERIAHSQIVSDIRAVMQTKTGCSFIKYLLDSYSFGEVPPVGLTGELLADRIGSMRAGVLLFQIIAEADPDLAGKLVGQIQKERYVKNE